MSTTKAHRLFLNNLDQKIDQAYRTAFNLKQSWLSEIETDLKEAFNGADFFIPYDSIHVGLLFHVTGSLIYIYNFFPVVLWISYTWIGQ